jgi:helix-turn-helix protein
MNKEQIDFHKIVEDISGKSRENMRDNEFIKFELKRRLTKKEYKTLVHLYSGGEREELAQKLNMDTDRADTLFESAKKKVRLSLDKLFS